MTSKSIVSSRKRYKRNKIMEIIRTDKNVSKFYLQQQTSYGMTTVTEIVETLIHEGLVFEVESSENRVGRRPVWLNLNPEGAFSVGLEFNGSLMHCVLINMLGKIVSATSSHIDREGSSDQIISMMLAQIETVLKALPKEEKSRLLGIGVGVPGYFDESTGTALSYATIPAWKNVPIVGIIQNHFSVPCHIENNVNVMAFAYRWLHSATMPENFLFVSVRTGIRIVPVVKKSLILARSGSSGQLGHTKVNGRNRKCHCGKYGCLNTECTETGIKSSIVEGYLVSHQYQSFVDQLDQDFSKINITTILSAVHNGDLELQELLVECASRLGETLAIMVDTFSPEEIQLSGSIFLSGAFFLKALGSVYSRSVV